MKRPPYLKNGDKIGIVSTARKISREALEPALKLMHDWGFEPILGKTIGKAYHQFAGRDGERAEDFQAMLDNPEIKAILCARGGYGTVRIIDKLDFSDFQQNPKWIIGFSDITVLLSHIQSNFGIEILHAPMPLTFPNNTEAALQSLKAALKGKPIQYEFPSHSFNRNGTAKGILVGGNLSVLYSISGTVSDVKTQGRILFLEDLDEYLYHVDRMVVQLKRSGKFNDLAGLMIGGLSDMNDNEIPYGRTAEEIIQENLAEFDFPIAYNAPVGHIEDNRAFYVGREAELKAEPNSSLLRFL